MTRVALYAPERDPLVIRPTEPVEPMDEPTQESQLLPSRRPLTPAHKALIAILAEHLVEQYLAEEDRAWAPPSG